MIIRFPRARHHRYYIDPVWTWRVDRNISWFFFNLPVMLSHDRFHVSHCFCSLAREDFYTVWSRCPIKLKAPCPDRTGNDMVLSGTENGFPGSILLGNIAFPLYTNQCLMLTPLFFGETCLLLTEVILWKPSCLSESNCKRWVRKVESRSIWNTLWRIRSWGSQLTNFMNYVIHYCRIFRQIFSGTLDGCFEAPYADEQGFLDKLILPSSLVWTWANISLCLYLLES